MKKCCLIQAFLCLLLCVCIVFMSGCESSPANSSEPSNNSNQEVPEAPVKDKLETPEESTTQSISFLRESCSENNGYDSQKSGSTSDIQTHKQFDELVSATVEGLKRTSSDAYTLVGNKLTVSLILNENPEALPKHGDAGWWNWYENILSNDTYNGQVKGTCINNEAIGRGAFYICLNYESGKSEELYKCNFLNGMEKNSVKEYELAIDAQDKLVSMNIVIVYEIHWEHYTNLTWHKGNSNWRLSATIQIN